MGGNCCCTTKKISERINLNPPPQKPEQNSPLLEKAGQKAAEKE